MSHVTKLISWNSNTWMKQFRLFPNELFLKNLDKTKHSCKPKILKQFKRQRPLNQIESKLCEHGGAIKLSIIHYSTKRSGCMLTRLIFCWVRGKFEDIPWFNNGNFIPATSQITKATLHHLLYALFISPFFNEISALCAFTVGSLPIFWLSTN